MSPQKNKLSAVLLIPVLVLLGAVALIIYGERQSTEQRFHGTLADILPAAPPGWTKTLRPIAETPEMQKAVGQLLNFDDGIFVDYANGDGKRLSVYIAYWTPGRMSHRLVAVHTPDVCWIGNGWKKETDGNTAAILPLLPVGEARSFSANSRLEHVWFWHLVGSESKRYGTGHAPPWHAVISDLFRKGLRQREEQFFIRLSSDSPLEAFLQSPVLPRVLESIPWPQ